MQFAAVRRIDDFAFRMYAGDELPRSQNITDEYTGSGSFGFDYDVVELSRCEQRVYRISDCFLAKSYTRLQGLRFREVPRIEKGTRRVLNGRNRFALKLSCCLRICIRKCEGKSEEAPENSCAKAKSERNTKHHRSQLNGLARIRPLHPRRGADQHGHASPAALVYWGNGPQRTCVQWTCVRRRQTVPTGHHVQSQRGSANAIDELSRGLLDGEKHQVLLGVTGSGKTFTMAKVIEKLGRPALVLAHNKTLAAQLYHEFRRSFRRTPSSTSSAITTTTSPKRTSRRATSTSKRKPPSTTSWTSCASRPRKSLFERRDCVIVASVSCIYGLGSPEAYYGMLLMLEKGQKISRKEITSKLVEILYDRNDSDFRRGTFRVRGDVIEVFPTYDENAYRIELWGDEVESLSQIDPLLGQVKQTYQRLPIYPKTHYVMSRLTKEAAIESIKAELEWWRPQLEEAGQADRGAAPAPAHHVRSRNDEGDRLLPRDRELLAAFLRPAAGRSAADAARLPAAAIR